MTADRKPRQLLVTGMSGAGKSSVLDALEDLGWDVVDNLPADLLGPFVNAGAECRVAPAAVDEVVEQIDRQIVDRVPAHVLELVEHGRFARPGHAGDEQQARQAPRGGH